MAHATARSGYRDLVERLNRFPQGAPPSDLLYRILALLFTEREAGLVALLPVKPFTLATASRAWKTSADETRKILDALAARALVQFGENWRESVAFICNCCGCCCEALLAQKRFWACRPVHTTGFLPEVDAGRCNGCGACAKACPVEAMSLGSAGNPEVPGRRVASLADDACLGCGVCVPACRRDALCLVRREQRVIPPRDTTRSAVFPRWNGRSPESR